MKRCTTLSPVHRWLRGAGLALSALLVAGGVLGGVTTDIYSEGIQIPIVKYQKAGVVNQELVDIIRMNVRIPERAMGDLRAQITAVKTGERRFTELLDRYGREPVLAAIRNIMDHSEAAARAHTRTIPDGIYEAESEMDDDGVDIGKRVPIKVRVVVKGDEMTVDLSDVSRQVRGGFNSGATTGHGCAQVAYKCLTSPTDYPINEGSFRALKVQMTPGTVVTAVRPAAMRTTSSTPPWIAARRRWCASADGVRRSRVASPCSRSPTCCTPWATLRAGTAAASRGPCSR